MHNLKGQLLIAMPSLADLNFFQTVTLICDHNENGAMGLIINRPTNLSFSDLLHDLQIQAGNELKTSKTVYFGGPVQVDRGFVLHLDHNYSADTQKVNEFISITASRDIIQSIASEGRPETSIITLGFAGWSAGQIESEIKQNSWLTVPCDESLVFHTPSDDLWKVAASTIGVDVSLLVNEAGNA